VVGGDTGGIGGSIMSISAASSKVQKQSLQGANVQIMGVSKAYNYIDCLQLLTISTTSISPDTIHLTIKTNILENLTALLTALGFKVTSDSFSENCEFKRKSLRYNRVKKFKHTNFSTTIELFYDKNIFFGDYYSAPELLVQIQEPNILLLINIYDLVEFLETSINLSRLELAIDISSNDNYALKKFIEGHLFLKYSRTNPFKFKTTWYAGDIRKPVRGIRCYSKSINKGKIIRLELVLKRPTIKRLGLSPTLSNLHNISLERFFDFREVDTKKLLNSQLYIIRDQLKEKGGKDSISGRIMISTIGGLIGSKYDTVMKSVQALKQCPHYKKSYGRFIGKLDEFNGIFFSKLDIKNCVE